MDKALISDKDGKGYFKKILLFSIPLMLTGLLQSLYSAADLVVVGRFDGELALAAVGSTGSLTNLILGLFMGLAVGAGVCVAHGIGAKRYDDVQKTLHTAVATALILGVFIGIVGYILAPQMLRLMDTPDDVIDMASTYIRIIFLGAPAAVLYNYCASMLRSAGDSKRPLIFLAVSGVVNVILNIVLVAGFHMGVAGVAIGTIASQLVSAVLVMVYLVKTKSVLHFSVKNLRIHKDKLIKILKIGIPSGIQGSLFSFANVIIQSSINSFGSTVMSGSSASANIEGFYYVAYNSFYHAALTFVGQCVGAKRFGDIKKIVLYSIANNLIFAAVLITVGLVFKDALLGLYVPDSPEAMAAASQRYMVLIIPYFLCGIMEIASGTLRGMGRSMTSAIISLVGACLFRVVWISTVFEYIRTPECIYISFPISWVLTAAVSFIFAAIAVKKEMRLQKMYSLERVSQKII
ncbi:MAG: MATE family efflux transporter [Clostridia bacterium]|nr:MATE family efflux transporter [Clostridia bacterium]